MPIWGGGASRQTGPSADPNRSVTSDANASVTQSDIDAVQSNVQALAASLGSPTDPASSLGNVYERLNFLDQRLNQNVGDDLGDVNTLLDVRGNSVLIAATTTNRYVNAFDGSDRGNIQGAVNNSIHNSDPVTVRESLRDLDAATTNARLSIFGKATGAYSATVSVGGTGYVVNEIVSNGSLRAKVTSTTAGGSVASVVVVAGGDGYAVNDIVELNAAAAGGDKASIQITAICGARRTESDLGSMECSIIEDGSSVRTALRQLDTEASSARSDIGQLQNLAGFDNNNGDVVGALNELRDELGDITNLNTDVVSDAVSAINEIHGEVDSNVTNIATNVTDIATNVTNIATNVSNIAENKTSIVAGINTSASCGVGMYLVLSDESVNDGTYAYDAGRVIDGQSLFLKLIGVPAGATIEWEVPGTTTPVQHSTSSTYGEGLMFDTSSAIGEQTSAPAYRITTVNTSSDTGIYVARAKFGDTTISTSNKLSVRIYASDTTTVDPVPSGDLAGNSGGTVSTLASSNAADAFRACSSARNLSEHFERVVAVTVTDGGSGYDAANPPSVSFGNMDVAASASVTVDNAGSVSAEVVTDGGYQTMDNVTVTIDAPAGGGDQATAEAIFEVPRLNEWSSGSLFGNGAALRTNGPGGLRCEWIAMSYECEALAYEVCWTINNYRRHHIAEKAPHTVVLYGSNDANPFESTDAVILTDTDTDLKSSSSWTLLDAQSYIAGRMRFILENTASYKHYLLAVPQIQMPHAHDYMTTGVTISDFRIFEEAFFGAP